MLRLCKRLRARRGESGNTLIIVLLLLLVLSAVGAGLLIVASVDIDIASNQRTGEMALFYADFGIRDSTQAVQQMVDGGQLGLVLANVNQGCGTCPEVPVTSDGATIVPGASYLAQAELDFNEFGCPYECQEFGQNIASGGSGTTYGRIRAHVVSTGLTYLPGTPIGNPNNAYAQRTVEALVLSQPKPNICPCEDLVY